MLSTLCSFTPSRSLRSYALTSAAVIEPCFFSYLDDSFLVWQPLGLGFGKLSRKAFASKLSGVRLVAWPNHLNYCCLTILVIVFFTWRDLRIGLFRSVSVRVYSVPQDGAFRTPQVYTFCARSERQYSGCVCHVAMGTLGQCIAVSLRHFLLTSFPMTSLSRPKAVDASPMRLMTEWCSASYFTCSTSFSSITIRLQKYDRWSRKTIMTTIGLRLVITLCKNTHIGI